MITLIAAITRDGALGKDGDMLYHISADLKRFKSITMGHPIIMGRRTFESFPNGPLPGRRNLVVTRNPGYTHPGVETFTSLEDAVKAADGDAYVIGGGQIYAQSMPLAQCLEITEIGTEGKEAGADTFFPAIDPTTWQITSESDRYTDPRSGAPFRFLTYQRIVNNE